MVQQCPADVQIVDRGRVRTVKIRGRFREHGRLRYHGTSFETFYSRQLVEMLLAVKGKEWLKDEIDRSEDPGYLQMNFKMWLGRFFDLTDQYVLDFGCGCGASSIVLARLGAYVVGVDPSLASLYAAHQRVRECGLLDRVMFFHVRDTARLPFVSGSFSSVVCYHVLEHVAPSDRPRYLREMWRMLRRKGYLFVAAPNRLWPVEFHTTGLWWVPYMPLHWAIRYSKCRGRIASDTTSEELLARGMRGVSYWEIVNAIKDAHAVELNRDVGDDLDSYFAVSMGKRQRHRCRVMKNLIKLLYRGFDILLWRPLSMPSGAFLPYVIVCLQKAA